MAHTRAAIRDPLTWPRDPMLVALTALDRARSAGQGPAEAPRLVLHARALHSRQRRAASDLLYDLLRLGSRLDARLQHAVDQGLLAAPRNPGEREKWRLAALCHAERGVEAAQVAAVLGLAEVAVAGLGGEAFLHGRTGPARLAVTHAMPLWLMERLMVQQGEAFTDALCQAFNARAPLTLRAVPPREGVLHSLIQQGIAAQATRLSPHGITLHSHLNVRSLPPFQEARVEVQDEGSQIIALCVAPRPLELILDGCAGAGGKTLAILAAEPKAHVVAVEPGRLRLQELRRRARRAGVTLRTVQSALEGPALQPWLGQADAVLLDAPCSGTGTWRREPLNRWRYQAADIERFAATQTELLARGVELVKPGGRLIYATCSVLKEENEDVVAQALRGSGGVLERLPLAELLGPLAGAAGARDHELRLWPHQHGTDGFYVAALRKRAG